MRYWSRENLSMVNISNYVLTLSNTNFFVNLNSAKCLEVLRQRVVPEMQRITEEGFDEIRYQEDSCPAHNNHLDQHYLNGTFPNRSLSDIVASSQLVQQISLHVTYFYGISLKEVAFEFEMGRAGDLNALIKLTLNPVTKIHE